MFAGEKPRGSTVVLQRFACCLYMSSSLAIVLECDMSRRCSWHCEADRNQKALQVAKLSELNAQLLMDEQFSRSEALEQETARLKRELAEAEAQCVICRDAKPSKAFVPCGHVCVCIACWDGLVQSGSGRSLACPKCRREVQFSFPVFI